MVGVSHRMPRTCKQFFWCGFSISSTIREQVNIQRDILRATEWWHEKHAQCAGWGIFVLRFPFLEGTAHVTGAASDKINCTKAMNNSPERKVSHVLWMNTVYLLSGSGGYWAEPVPWLRLFKFIICVIYKSIFGIFFLLSEIKGTNRGWKTNEVGKQCQSTQDWSLQTLWALILFLIFCSHRFLFNCGFCPGIVVPIRKKLWEA